MSSLSQAQVASTPVRQIATAGPAAANSPGNWKHPRLAEIARRQSKNTFSERNIRQVIYNAAALVAIGLVRQVVVPLVPSWLIPPSIQLYTPYLHLSLLLIPLLNILLALLPLVRPKDDLADIPLTPSQRKLLGLVPTSSRPGTPDSAYSTPPRYSRTPSLAGSPASIKSYASSPLAGAGSPASGQYSSPRFNSASPSKLAPGGQYSPSPVSPLLHKAVNGGARRGSFGSTSPLGASTGSSVFGGDGPSTPTPAAGKRSSVSLNNKWLYEKGRRGSGSGWGHS
ncbi:nuclear pore complex component-domain-containing protein [Staphylotrichum tortipilum]|uniref:Nuclear pore complex component-domain-containing protein n=1 Tax=Staphylotrichum tortipilum TaxID=2831512 RepID=A0AAN6MQN3_9PEZI|nr:nuclear pore complex component-domain-containing protein [Staphylotrichum longicolle]